MYTISIITIIYYIFDDWNITQWNGAEIIPNVWLGIYLVVALICFINFPILLSLKFWNNSNIAKLNHFY